MGQVEKIFVVSIVGLVLLILAITVFGPSHQDAQACVVPPGSESAGVENPLQPPGGGGLPPGGETQEPGAEIPAMVVEKVGEPVPAAIPEGTDSGPEGAVAPKEGKTTPTPGSPESLAEPSPNREEKPAAPTATPSFKAKPVVPFVVVQKGEALGEILQRELGSAHRYLDLVLQFNEGMDPDHLREGQKIWLPPNLPAAATRTRSSKTSAPPAVKAPKPAPLTYKVKKGDSLWKIATRFFGKKKVLEGIRKIKQANADKDLDLLPAGLVLAIPR